ncbi:S41 family peptidase [soil metagenome]
MYQPTPSHSRISKLQVTALMLSVLCAVAIVAFAAGAYFEQSLLDEPQSNGPIDVSSLTTDSGNGVQAPTFDRLEEVTRLIEDEYYLMPGSEESAEQFWQALEEEAVQGLTEGLDGHSAYLVPTDSEAAADTLSGSYEGIGVWISARDGTLHIVAPVPGSPAEAAGIRAGDVIVEIDGVTTDGMDDASAVDALVGPTGETVELVIRRDSTGELLPFSVVRKRINYPVVAYTFDDETDIAIIQISIFGDRTTAELDSALKRAKEDGAIGIVLDLRNNGGGWVQSAQETIGRFLPEDTGPALYEDFDPLVDGDEQEEEIIGGGISEFELPVAVLVNQGTASASEIVAGALSDYDRAVVIGETTFGKGSVQRVHEFDDGASLRLTFAQWLTPEKRTIEDEGLTPDIEVLLTDDANGVDEQLDAAVDHLTGVNA